MGRLLGTAVATGVAAAPSSGEGRMLACVRWLRAFHTGGAALWRVASFAGKGARAWSRPAGLVLAAAVGACVLAVRVDVAYATTDFTWSGVAEPSDGWSVAGNWLGDVAPNGSIGGLAFPAVTPPMGDAVEQSVNDLGAVTASELSIDDGTPYLISGSDGSSFTLGAGGLVATTSSSVFAPAELSLPVTLEFGQTWSIDGGASGQGELISDGDVAGSSEPLTVDLRNQGFLVFSLGTFNDVQDSNEVGDVAIAGLSGSETGLNAYVNGAVGVGAGSTLDATDGNAITLSDAAIFGEGTLGPVSSSGGVITAGDPLGTLAVNGAVTLDASSALQFAIAGGGTTAGTDYSQLSASGSVSLNGAALDITGTDVDGNCPALTAGAVDTLLVTSGTLTGTFANVPDGAIVALDCIGSVVPQVEINYTAHAVTATLGPISTSTTLSALPQSPNVGQPVTLSANVSAGATTPSGTIDFESDGSTISGCGAVTVTGRSPTFGAVCTTSFASAGSHSLRAVFNPANPGFQTSSASPALPVSVIGPGTDQTLTVGLTGTGSGAVHGLGISCPSSCSAPIPTGQTIALSATPASGSTFAGWSGGGCSGTGACNVTLTADETVTATFDLAAGGSTSRPPPAPRCTLTPKTDRVLLSARTAKPGSSKSRAGTLALAAKCNQNARVTVAGAVTELVANRLNHAKPQHRTFDLATAHTSVSAGKTVVITLKLPTTALAALATRAPESAMLVLEANNAHGQSRTTARIVALKPSG
jgi:hypothetical protein